MDRTLTPTQQPGRHSHRGDSRSSGIASNVKGTTHTGPGADSEVYSAGLVTVELRADGEDGCELTPKREQVARQVAMSSEDDMVALLDALLEADLG